MKHLWPIAFFVIMSMGWLGCEPSSDGIDAGIDAGTDAGTGGSAGIGGMGGAGGACDTPEGTIFGVAVDETDERVPIEGMRVVAVPSTGSQGVTAEETDAEGQYTLQVCDQQTYTMSAQVVVGSRYMSTNGTDTVDVGLGASEEYDIDARRGYFLEAVLQNADPVVVSPGATFDLTIDYRAWSRVGCPGCSYRIVVGFEGSYAGTAELGQGNYDETSGGNVGEVVIPVVAPSSAGTYEIYARHNPGALDQGQTVYEGSFLDPKAFIELGTLSVVEP